MQCSSRSMRLGFSVERPELSADMLRIAVVANRYPSAVEPDGGAYVYSLVQEFCRQGSAVTTIAPRSVYDVLRSSTAARVPYGRERGTVLRPRFISFSNRVLREGWSTALLGAPSFTGSVLRSGKRLPFAPNVIYGHFLFYAGAATVRLAQQLQVPAVVAMGESDPGRIERLFGLERMRRVAQRCDAILPVSEQIQDYCVKRLAVPAERVFVAPNAPDPGHFYPRSRAEMRRKFGLPQEIPIVAFAGGFKERKGPLRLLAAIKAIPNVGGIFLGDGPQRPTGEKVLFAGRVPHDQVPEWLSAADLFVLPTLTEGCCNAVAEALACGLPVITSDLPEMRSQVGEGAALLTSPRDVPALETLIRTLIGDPQRRKEMATVALERAKSYTLPDRAQNILSWIEALLKERKGGIARRQIKERYGTFG